MMPALYPAEALHAQRNARMPCACTVHYPVVTTSGLTLDERSRLLMVDGSLYLHEWDGAAVLARHFEETQAPHAQKDRTMPNVLIDSKALENLRRDAARAAPRASKPTPKAKTKAKPTTKPRTDPQRQAKLDCIEATPLKAEDRRALKLLVSKNPSHSLETVKASLAAERYHYTNAYDAKERAAQIQAESKDESRRQTQLRSRMPFTLSSEVERTVIRDAGWGIGVVRCQVHHHGQFYVDRRLHVAQIESMRSQGAIIYPINLPNAPRIARGVG